MTAACTLLPELTIHEAASAADALRAWLVNAEPTPGLTLTVDGRAVQDIDGAGLQLLAALRGSVAARGQQLAIDLPSPALARALALLQPAWGPETQPEGA